MHQYFPATARSADAAPAPDAVRRRTRERQRTQSTNTNPAAAASRSYTVPTPDTTVSATWIGLCLWRNFYAKMHEFPKARSCGKANHIDILVCFPVERSEWH